MEWPGIFMISLGFSSLVDGKETTDEGGLNYVNFYITSS